MQVLLPVMIFTAGPISGAHFNPMVTSVFVMARMQVFIRLEKLLDFVPCVVSSIAHDKAMCLYCLHQRHCVVQSLSSGICYVIAQCLGGIFGAAGAFYSLPGQSFVQQLHASTWLLDSQQACLRLPLSLPILECVQQSHCHCKRVSDLYRGSTGHVSFYLMSR